MTNSDVNTEVLIVGAGACGLCAALLLHEAGHSVRIVEAHSKPGGRIRSVLNAETGSFVADLGPSWVWPAHQSVVRRWLAKLGLDTFPQFDEGRAVLDFGPEQEGQTGFLPGQDGNERIDGGSQALIDALAARLPAKALLTGTRVCAVECGPSGVFAHTDGSAPEVLSADRMIMAVPPRIAAASIEWKPDLPPELHLALRSVPTWMAPHAKVVATYETPFWRERGLSGRIASRTGPLVEAHDHCEPDGSPAALWGFIGWPYETRKELGGELKSHIAAQLQRCFGAGSPAPVSIHVEDWAENPHVAAPEDLTGPMEHPGIGPNVLRTAHAAGRVIFAASETALQSPGLIEGALAAAEYAASTLLTGNRKPNSQATAAVRPSEHP